MGYLLLWVFCFGACFGSFMNVVIYRVPARINLAWPPSSCPLCKHAIRPFDNVPVLAWLWLKGRCRDCKASISPRYPLVEALVGLLFVAVVIGEINTQGEYLPIPAAQALHLLPESQQQTSLWLTAVQHLWVLCVLFCAAFIAYDGKSPTWPFWLISLIVALCLAEIPSALKPVPLSRTWPGPEWLIPLAGAASGLALGALLGTLIRRSQSSPIIATAGASALCGAALGWQGVTLVLPIVTLGWAVDRGLSNLMRLSTRLPWTAYLTLITLLHSLQWRLIHQFLAFPV